MGNTVVTCGFPSWASIDPQTDSRCLRSIVFCGNSHTIFKRGDLCLGDVHAGRSTRCRSRPPANRYLCKTIWVLRQAFLHIYAPCLALTWVTPYFDVRAFKGVWMVNKRDAILENPYNLYVLDVICRVHAPRTESTEKNWENRYQRLKHMIINSTPLTVCPCMWSIFVLTY